MSELPGPGPLRMPKYAGGFYQLVYKVKYSGFVADVHQKNPRIDISRAYMETLWVDSVKQHHVEFMKQKSRGHQAKKQQMLEKAILQPHAPSKKMARYWQAMGDDSTMEDLEGPGELYGVPLEELMAFTDAAPYLSTDTDTPTPTRTKAEIAAEEFQFGQMTLLRLISEKRNEAREAGMSEAYINSAAFIAAFKAWLAKSVDATAAVMNVAESPEFLKFFNEAL